MSPSLSGKSVEGLLSGAEPTFECTREGAGQLRLLADRCLTRSTQEDLLLTFSFPKSGR